MLWNEEGFAKPIVDPRLGARYRLSDRTALFGGVGRHSQFPTTRQMLTEAWRMQRDFFWDEGMSGIDWPAVLEHYLPILEA